MATKSPSDTAPEASTRATSGRALAIFAVGFVLRIGFLILTGRARMNPDDFAFGWEAGRIAHALVSGRGFADPFGPPTGPTSWLAPLYPCVLALIFEVGGAHSPVSALLTAVFNSVCTAATAVVVYETGALLFGERDGRRAGWTWALLPYAIAWPTRIIWDTSLTACLLAWVFLLTIRLGRSSSPLRWAAFGLSWGLVALTNPAPLAFAPVSWGWAFLRCRGRPGFRVRHAVAAAALGLLCTVPWLVRNEATFGTFVFLRGNFGAELRLGNGPGALGPGMRWLHPTLDPAELARYEALGERAYVAARGREAVEHIREHPALFAANTARRIYWFWCGTTLPGAAESWIFARSLAYTEATLLSVAGLLLMASRRKPEAVLFAGLLLLFPLAYYITFVEPRYREPIDPEMFLLVAYVVSTLPLRRPS